MRKCMFCGSGEQLMKHSGSQYKCRPCQRLRVNHYNRGRIKIEVIKPMTTNESNERLMSKYA